MLPVATFSSNSSLSVLRMRNPSVEGLYLYVRRMRNIEPAQSENVSVTVPLAGAPLTCAVTEYTVCGALTVVVPVMPHVFGFSVRPFGSAGVI